VHVIARLLGFVFFALLAVSAHGSTTAFPGHNGKIAFQEGGEISPSILVVNPDGSGRIALTRPGETCAGPRCGGQSPTWSPDGKTIVYAKTYDHRGLWLMDMSGRVLRQVVSADRVQGRPEDPDWSPDGRRIVFETFTNIGVIGADGRHPKVLVDNRPSKWKGAEVDFQSPKWSPAGGRIAFVRLRERGPEQIFVMDATGKGIRQLTTSPDTTAWSPSWSPDGSKIAFLCFGPGGHGPVTVMTMNPDGSNPVTVARLHRRSSGLTWSPDGKKLAFVDGSAIFVMNADGSNRRFVTAGEGPLSWQPRP
jgi:Tol biopolymer transport system component